jgi:peptidoglycan/LPS O-acetylase OafA/YrhL
MHSTASPARIQSLHGLRGIMAWWVVLGHVSLALDWRLPLIERNGLAVDVFILLSGFVIALLLERRGEPYPAYIVRRAFRLFPLYLLVLGLSFLLLPVQLAAWEAAAASAANLHRAALAREALADPLLHLSAHVPLAQGLVPKAWGGNVAYTVVGQAWSISLEWQFYLVAPLLVAAMAAARWWRVGAAVLALVALAPFFTTAFL